MRKTRKCAFCGKEFTCNSGSQKYCSEHCAEAAKAKVIPISVISEGMGHDSEATTQIYLASLDTSVVDKANSLILIRL